MNTVSLTISFSHCDCTAHLVAVPPPVWGCCGVRRQPVYPFALPVGPRLCPVASSFLTAQPLTTIPPFLCWRRPRRLASLIEANYLGVDLEIIRNPLSLCHIPCMPDPSQRKKIARIKMMQIYSLTKRRNVVLVETKQIDVF